MRCAPARCSWRTAAACQLTLAALTIVTLAFAPPVHGRMLLIPLDGHGVEPDLLRSAMLSPVAAGPLPGSVVVEGIGRPLAARMLDQGIVMLAAPAALCGRSASVEGER